VAGNGVELLSQTQQQWEKFDLMLDSHQMMIKEQVGYLKINFIK
jgi:dynein heavy chain 2